MFNIFLYFFEFVIFLITIYIYLLRFIAFLCRQWAQGIIANAVVPRDIFIVLEQPAQSWGFKQRVMQQLRLAATMSHGRCWQYVKIIKNMVTYGDNM